MKIRVAREQYAAWICQELIMKEQPFSFSKAGKVFVIETENEVDLFLIKAIKEIEIIR